MYGMQYHAAAYAAFIRSSKGGEGPQCHRRRSAFVCRRLAARWWATCSIDTDFRCSSSALRKRRALRRLTAAYPANAWKTSTSEGERERKREGRAPPNDREGNGTANLQILLHLYFYLNCISKKLNTIVFFCSPCC